MVFKATNNQQRERHKFLVHFHEINKIIKFMKRLRVTDFNGFSFKRPAFISTKLLSNSNATYIHFVTLYVKVVNSLVFESRFTLCTFSILNCNARDCGLQKKILT